MYIESGFSIFGKFPMLESLFLNINTYSPLLPIILFLVFRKSLNQKEGLWVIFFYCVYSFINDTVLLGLLSNIIKDGERIFVSLFTLGEFLFFSFYIKNIVESKWFKNLVIIISAIFSLFLTVYFFSVEFRFFDSIPVGTESVLIIAFCIYYFFEQINKPTALFIYNTSSFWIIVGFLLYLAGSFFIFIYASYVPFDEIRKFWFVTFIFNTLKNVFFSIAILISYYNNRNKNNNVPNPYVKSREHILN